MAYGVLLDEAMIVEITERYARALGVSAARVSLLAVGDGKFINRLRAGGTCTLRTARRVVEYLSDRWPDDELEWPDEIPRPPPRPKSKHEAAV